MKKLLICILSICMIMMTGCSSGKKENTSGNIDDAPAVVDEQPEEFIVINNDSYDELVKILDGKNLYRPDEFYKGEFSNTIGLTGYQYEWMKTSVNGKEFTLGNTVYHLTGEVLGGRSSQIRFEAEEATLYLCKDDAGYWGLYVTEKGTNGPVGIPYTIADQFTVWQENEAWNKGYIKLKEKVYTRKQNNEGCTIVLAYRRFYCGINKEFYDKVVVSSCAKSSLIIRVDKSAENYDYYISLSKDMDSATFELGDVSKIGGRPKADLLGSSVFPQYHSAANSPFDQYEEDGMIWFSIYERILGEFYFYDHAEWDYNLKCQDAKYTVNVYTNYFFLPKNFK